MKLKFILPFILTVSLSGCANWIFRIDVAQGNYLIQQDIEKLRIGMTKEQVEFVLGKPVVRDSFADNVYYYVYTMKRGMKTNGDDYKSNLFLHFENDKLAKLSGDFEEPEDFNTPLDI